MARKSARRPAKPTRKARRPALPKMPPGPASAGVASGLAPGMQAINTYLAVANVAASIDFLERAFGFARGVVLPDAEGQPRYAEMRHGNSVVMLIRRGDLASATLGTSSLYTYVDDVDKQLAAAREAGAGVGEAEDKPWGDRVVVVTDPDGYRWVLASFKKLAPFS
jgi:uncharacterized glyoxalase superfamily protein PhnB